VAPSAVPVTELSLPRNRTLINEVLVQPYALASAYYADRTTLIAIGVLAGVVLTVLNILEMRKSK
jgi:hypothetical protein